MPKTSPRPRAAALALCALAALAAAAPEARAQDVPPPPPPPSSRDAGKDDARDPVRLGDLPEEPARAPATTAAGPVLPERSEPEALVAMLSRWPSTEAKQASVRLAAQPSVAYPLLEREMLASGQDWRTVCGVAATLGKIGDLRAVELLQAKLQDRALYSHSPDLLDALIRVDPVGARPRLLALLLHPASAVVAEVAQRLEERVGPGDAETLRDLVEAGGPAARSAALTLLQKADPAAARVDLANALRDRTPEVASAAARALGQDASPEALAVLRRATTSPIDRQLAYAWIAMVHRGERTGTQVVDPTDAAVLLGGRGLRSLEPLNRAAAAILLADTGYSYEVAGVDEALDRDVVPALLEVVAGNRFWPDLNVVQPLARRRLERLSGRWGIRTPQEWVAWWELERGGFVARRVLRSVDPASAGTLVLTVAGTGAPGGETTVVAASDAALAEIVPEGLVLLVPGDEARALAEAVNASRVLDVPEGLTGPLETGGPLRFGVRAGRRERQVAVDPAALGPEGEALLARIEDLRARYGWQRYRTGGAAGDLARFVEVVGPRFSDEVPEAERRATLASLLVAAIDDRRGADWNDRALAELRALPDLGAVLAEEDLLRLVGNLGRRTQLDAVAEGIVRALSASGRQEAHPLLVDFLVTRPSPAAAALLADVLRAAGPAERKSAILDERPFVRAAAVASLEPGGLGEDTEIALLAKLEDPDAGVRAEAVRALGRLRLEGARAELERLATEPGELRTSAVEALGMLGGKASLAVVMSAFADHDPALRVAALRAFAASREPEGLSAMVFAMSGDPDPMVREVAHRSVVGIGTERAGLELRKLAVDPAQPSGPRARAVAGYALLRGRDARADLARLVADPADEVADEAALALGRWREAAAVARLIEMLSDGRSAGRARHALEAISLEAFGDVAPERLPELYTGWWELSRERGPRGWLVDALALEGVDDPKLHEWAAQRATLEAVPGLLRGLRSERWYVRRACDLALRELLGRTVGEQEPWTPPDDQRRMAAEWESLWAAQSGR